MESELQNIRLSKSQISKKDEDSRKPSADFMKTDTLFGDKAKKDEEIRAKL